MLLLVALVCFFSASALHSQISSPAIPSPNDVLQYLTHTIEWYHETAAEQKIAAESGDLAYMEDNRRLADQIVKLSFDYARQQADWISKQGKSGQPQPASSSGSTQLQALVHAANSVDQQVQQTQSELLDLRKKIDSAPTRKRNELESQIAETQSELNLLNARSEVLHSIIDFANSAASNGVGATGLRAQIEELARSLPNGIAETPNNPQSSPAPAAVQTVNRDNPSGIWGLTAELFRLSSKRRTLEQQVRSTDTLASSIKVVRSPLIAELRSMLQSSNQLLSQPDSTDPTVLAQQKQKIDTLTAQFRQLSGALMPLNKQSVLLDLYKRSLMNWRESVRTEFFDDLRNLLVRLAALLAVIGAIFVIGEIGRRATFRYVQDVRRRYQFLLLRRILVWNAIIVVLVFTFATEIGSIATFAGLITAGVAVAMQNVIVSIVGYFFLIGKYGIRVGDRVQVGAVMGEVVEIGLARFHLMELSSDAPESEPTGRVVAFSNSVVFQSAGGIFKQIPGTNFVWHHLQLTFAPDSDYHAVRDRVNAAVERTFGAYRDALERQTRMMEQSLTSITVSELKPRTRLRFMSSGIEVIISFPVLLQKASEMDDRLSRELLTEVDRQPALKLVGSDIPSIKTQA